MGRSVNELKIRIFADGADLEGIRRLSADPLVKGFTTNPTLMRQAGVTDYEAFAKEALAAVNGLPVSFEVFSDDFDEMYAQACHIAGWGDNVFVKIPVTDTSGRSSMPLVRALAREGVKVNVTAILTLQQVEESVAAVADGPASFISVFAGRIADTGVDPLPMIQTSLSILKQAPRAELIWASPREVLNIFQANDAGCHVITVTHDLLKKLATVGRDLSQFSLETVRMFRRDALAAGFTLQPAPAISAAVAQ